MLVSGVQQSDSVIHIYVCVCVHSLSGVQRCGPVDCSLPDPSVHGISQARILEWVAISSFRGIFLTQG